MSKNIIDTISVLNNLAVDLLGPIQDEYNRFVIPNKWEADANGKYKVPKYNSLENGLTKVPIDAETKAFALTNAVAGSISEEKIDSPADELVLRSYLSVAAMARVANAADDEAKELAFKQEIYPIVASMLKRIEKEKGFKNTEFSVGSSYIRFDQPGFDGIFFRLLENANAYEIRAYSDTRLLLDWTLL